MWRKIICAVRIIMRTIPRSIRNMEKIEAIYLQKMVSSQQRVYDTAHHGRDLMGVSYDTEREENLRTSMGTRLVRKVASLS